MQDEAEGGVSARVPALPSQKATVGIGQSGAALPLLHPGDVGGAALGQMSPPSCRATAITFHGSLRATEHDLREESAALIPMETRLPRKRSHI